MKCFFIYIQSFLINKYCKIKKNTVKDFLPVIAPGYSLTSKEQALSPDYHKQCTMYIMCSFDNIPLIPCKQIFLTNPVSFVYKMMCEWSLVRTQGLTYSVGVDKSLNYLITGGVNMPQVVTRKLSYHIYV